jgi:hypothetical protein
VAANVLVPNNGWVIFGGYANTLLTTQKLFTLSDSWITGPSLYQNATDFNNCGVQVNKKLVGTSHLIQ